jgi:hypothetical protein
MDSGGGLLLLSVLMFCDLTYSSFFNRYLSVNMIGAAACAGDITEKHQGSSQAMVFPDLADAALAMGTGGETQRLMKKQKGRGQGSLKENVAEGDQTRRFGGLIARMQWPGIRRSPWVSKRSTLKNRAPAGNEIFCRSMRRIARNVTDCRRNDSGAAEE